MPPSKEHRAKMPKAILKAKTKAKALMASWFFVECATDNSTPTVAKVKSYFNKAGLKRFPTSPVEFTEEQLDDIEKLLAKIEETIAPTMGFIIFSYTKKTDS
jgi:hypothetical protein